MNTNLYRIGRGALLAIAGAWLAFGATSCVSEDNNVSEFRHTYTFESNTSMDGIYTKEGYWQDVYNTEIKSVSMVPNLVITHGASESNYEGITYKNWSGFCFSRSKDNADHTGGDWMEYQWGSITGSGNNRSMDYLLAYWDTNENTMVPPTGENQQACCGFYFIGKTFPQSVAVTNSAYGYYAMLNGTDYSRAFTRDDWCKVIFKGVLNKQVVGTVELYLAQNGQIVNDWKTVDLTPLGQCDMIYMQMESSDSGQWGMNNPSYFCIDDLQIFTQLNA